MHGQRLNHCLAAGLNWVKTAEQIELVFQYTRPVVRYGIRRFKYF